MVTARALYDYSGATDEELNFYRDDTFLVLNNENPDWWFVRSLADELTEGYVPSTYVELMNDDQSEMGSESNMESSSKRKDSGQYSSYKNPEFEVMASRKLSKEWKNMKNNDDAADILSEFKNISPACRISTLATYHIDGSGLLSNTLKPAINATGTAFRDLFTAPQTNKVKVRPVQCTVGFSIMDAKSIENLTPGMTILGRQVRMALFDNTRVLSNVHSISAVLAPDQETTWKFSSKASLLFPKDDENTCFLKTNDIDLKLSVLFELCVLVERPENGANSFSEIVEVCIGWGVLPLFTSDGGPIENKSYDIKLYGGSPFEREAYLDNTPEKKGFFKSLIQGSKFPRLSIRVWKLGKTVIDEINRLPDTIITFLSAVPVMSTYRQILADNVIRDYRFGPSFNPSLSLFPIIAVQSDLLHLFILIWDRKTRSINHANDKAREILSSKFRECCLLIWPILYTQSFPDYIEGHEKVRMARHAHANMMQESGILENLAKSRGQQQPFDMRELTFHLQ